MSEDDKKYIRDYLKELSLASHQSKDREVSGLFKEIRAEIRSIRDDLDRLESAIVVLQESYTETVVKNVNTWNLTSERQRKIEWLIISGVVTAALAFLYTQA